MMTYLHRMKCAKCTIEWIVCSMFKYWSMGMGKRLRGPYCTECGSNAVYGIGTVGETDLAPAAVLLGAAPDDPFQPGGGKIDES